MLPLAALYQIRAEGVNRESTGGSVSLSVAMDWKSYLRNKTRRPPFLWRMVIAVLALGLVGGLIADHWTPRRGAQGAAIFPDQATAGEQLEELAKAGEWFKLWQGIPAVVYARFAHPGPVALALFSGCCWLAFSMQAAQVRGLRDQTLWLLLIAVVLGGWSVWPTYFLSMWIEHRWDLPPSAELVDGARYFILGVGLPEELAKLACFMPLLPILRRSRNELTVLMSAACVGLGFAIVENMGYFRASLGSDAVGRYLTANPLHMTLTGVAGLAVYRGVRDPRGWGGHALAMVGLMIFAHGLYDATIVIQELGDLAIAGSIIFALVVYQFFRELRELRPRRIETVSLTATFLLGVSLVTATTFVYASGAVGLGSACDLLVVNIVSLSLMVYLFLREMPDTMVTV